MIKHWVSRKLIFNAVFAVNALSNIIDRKSILPGQTDLKTSSSQNLKFCGFFSSPARAHTEIMLVTRLWRPRADNEIAHIAILSSTITFIIKPTFCNKFTFNRILLHMHCQMPLVRNRFYIIKLFWKWIVPKTKWFGSSFLHRQEHTQNTR